MAELSDMERFAAGGIFAIALAEAQRLQCGDTADGIEGGSKVFWSSKEFALTEDVFRFLKLNDHEQEALCQTAEVPERMLHLVSFIRTIASEDDGERTAELVKQEIALEKAVESIILTEEEKRSRQMKKNEKLNKERDNRNRVVSNVDQGLHEDALNLSPISPGEEDLLTSKTDDGERGGSSTFNDSDQGVEGYGSQKDDNAHDYESPKQEVLRPRKEQKVLEQQPLPDVEKLTTHLRVAILWELLSACVADTPREREGSSPHLEGYDARQRTALRLISSWLDIPWKKVTAMEVMVAYAAREVQEQRRAAEREVAARAESSTSSLYKTWKRRALIGAAAVTVGGVLAITGGLAAPALVAGLAAMGPAVGSVVPIGGAISMVATAAGTAAGSAAVIGAFGAAGAGLGGYKMARRTGGVEEFHFAPVGENHGQGRLAVGILVSGIVDCMEDFWQPWASPDADLERYGVVWESEILIALGRDVEDMIVKSAAQNAVLGGAALTAAATLAAGLVLPLAMINAANFIDSRWAIACDRADKAGLLLADVLLKHLHGDRPVTLIGYSMGARMVFSCLEHLAKQEGAGAGIVERVVLLGSPLPAKDQRWASVRKVVAGTFVNGFSTSDWTLGLLYRSSFLIGGVAGIQEVESPGIQNVDLTAMVKGHLEYRVMITRILDFIGIDP